VGADNILIIIDCQSRTLVAVDGNRSHLDIYVLDVAEDLGVQLFCIPAHCSHELQSLDKSFFSSLKSYYNGATKVNILKDISRDPVSKIIHTSKDACSHPDPR